MAMEDWAIVVGITKYPGLSELNGPERDALDFFSWVTSADGGGIDPSAGRAKLIISSRCDPPPPYLHYIQAQPKMDNILETLMELDDLAEQNLKNGDGRQAGRRLYLYFAGHGFTPGLTPGGQVALLTANSKEGVYGNHIPGTLWAEWLWASGYFEEILLFMDCCRDYKPRIPANPIVLGPPKLGGAATKKRLYCYASEWGKESWEREMDDREIHGVFTTTLMKGLRGAACDRVTRKITASSLRGYLKDAMPFFFAEKDRNNPGIDKTPKLPDYDDGDFTIAQVNDVPTYQITVNLPAELQNKALQLIYGSGAQMKIVDLNGAGTSSPLTLSRGSYTLKIKDEAVALGFDVKGIGSEDVTPK
jgi:Caspase domain